MVGGTDEDLPDSYNTSEKNENNTLLAEDRLGAPSTGESIQEKPKQFFKRPVLVSETKAIY